MILIGIEKNPQQIQNPKLQYFRHIGSGLSRYNQLYILNTYLSISNVWKMHSWWGNEQNTMEEKLMW